MASSIIHKWSVTALDTIPEYKGLTNVVLGVRWTVEAVDLYGATAVIAGATSFDPDGAAIGFTSMESLTEEQVLSWLPTQLKSDAEIESARLALSLYRGEDVAVALPWSP